MNRPATSLTLTRDGMSDEPDRSPEKPTPDMRQPEPSCIGAPPYYAPKQRMDDEPTIPDSRSRKWLKAIVWVYVIGMLVCDFTGLQLVPLRYGMLVSHGGFVLIMLAYRPPGLKGWVLVLLGLAVAAVATYQQLTRP